MPQEAEEDDYEDYEGVVVAEADDVATNSEHGFGVGRREREGGERKELLPWAPV